MSKLDKYCGVIPAFYACYDDTGNISPERIEKLAEFYLDKGVKGLYVGGSSGECIYQSVAERKLVLETVVDTVGVDMTIIAHIACPSTRESVELAKHAASLDGVDALAAIPPYYFALPENAIKDYWGAMIEATDLDFFIYNIPQNTQYSLSTELYKEMLNYSQVKGVKNSSMPVEDIYKFRNARSQDTVIFNGPDEQFLAGRVMGASGGIGGTYGVMPELFLKLDQTIREENITLAREIQYDINRIISALTNGNGHMYAMIKAILNLKGINIGGVRSPLPQVTEKDQEAIVRTSELIDKVIKKYNG